MDDPLGSSVGNWLEVRECIYIMNPELDPSHVSKDLTELTLALAGEMILQGGKATTLKQGVSMARDHLLNGKAWQKFRQMVVVQGGDISYIDSPEKYVPAKFSVSVQSGIVLFVHQS